MSLPNEILFYIIEQADMDSRKALRLVSRHFERLAAPYVLRNIRIAVSASNKLEDVLNIATAQRLTGLTKSLSIHVATISQRDERPMIVLPWGRITTDSIKHIFPWGRITTHSIKHKQVVEEAIRAYQAFFEGLQVLITDCSWSTSEDHHLQHWDRRLLIHGSAVPSPLTPFIDACTNVIKMDICLGTLTGGVIANSLFDQSYWPKLQDLQLTCLKVGDAALLDLLLRHSATLKTLTLSRVRMERQEDEVYHFKKSLPTWENFIETLGGTMVLEQLTVKWHFGGYSRNTLVAIIWDTFGPSQVSMRQGTREVPTTPEIRWIRPIS